MSDKVRIVSTTTITRMIEFTWDEFREIMHKEDNELTESSIMKMWEKLRKKKEHKLKDDGNYTYEKLTDQAYLIYEIMRK
jgi:hypothetical protein